MLSLLNNAERIGPNTIGQEMYIVWIKLAIAIGTFLLILFLKNVLVKYIIKGINKILLKLEIKNNFNIIEAIENPIKNFLLLLGVYIIIVTIFDIFNINALILNRVFNSCVLLLIAQSLINIVEKPPEIFNKFQDSDGKLDKIAYSFIAKFIKVAIIVVVVLTVAQEWGMPVKGLIASAGIGGAVIALASKDTAANIFAGISIIFDRSFSIGDWIQCGSVEGEVEDISIRSTKIRTSDKVLITIPNSTLANASILNFTKRDIRKISFVLGVTYDTSKEKIQICINRIQDMLLKESDVNKDGILVYFDSYNSSSLDIVIAYYTNKTSLSEYMKVKNDVNFKILDILESEKIDVAFPTTSVYIEK
ncbi:mechanosensitive ion channel family protein [Clostridium senegalense]|nr:mechanosensitive ion channel family protein [Clostridium senegalense]